MQFSELKELIKTEADNTTRSFEESSDVLNENIFRISTTDFKSLITEVGVIPEDIGHDSTEEKLFSKATDIVLAKTLQELGLSANVNKERANCADVFAKSNIHNYTLVADAKAFRLSRTAKNQKDFKVKSMVDIIIHDDCLKVLPQLESNSIHLILSDIPYGIGVDEWDVLHDNTNSAYLGTSPAQEKAGAIFKKRGKPLNGWSEADRKIPKQYYDWCMKWTGEWLRVLKPGGSAIVFSGRRLAHRCIAAFEDTGFIYKDMLCWQKDKAPHRAQRISVVFGKRGDNFNAEKWSGWRVGNLRPSFEPILWFMKPYQIGGTIADNMLENQVGAYNEESFVKYVRTPDNIIAISANGKDTGLHPTQKPLKLMQALIELTTSEGQIVLDPFCGSGTTCLASAVLNRHFIGIELENEYFEKAKRRIHEYQNDAQINLFSKVK